MRSLRVGFAGKNAAWLWTIALNILMLSNACMRTCSFNADSLLSLLCSDKRQRRFYGNVLQQFVGPKGWQR